MALHVMDEANQCLGCKKSRCQQGVPHPDQYPRSDPPVESQQAGRSRPQGGNCAVLPRVYLKSKNAGYFHFSAAPQQKSSGQQSASRCLPYYNSAPGCSAPLHLNYSSLSSGISSSKASIQLSLCHLSFSPFSLAATFCRCAWSFIMVPIGFSARSSIMW